MLFFFSERFKRFVLYAVHSSDIGLEVAMTCKSQRKPDVWHSIVNSHYISLWHTYNALKPKCGTSQKDYRLRKFQRQILFSFELCASVSVCAGISNSLKHSVECEVQICEREFFVQRIKLFTLSLLGSHYSLARHIDILSMCCCCCTSNTFSLHVKCKLWMLHHADASVILIICTQHSHARSVYHL